MLLSFFLSPSIPSFLFWRNKVSLVALGLTMWTKLAREVASWLVHCCAADIQVSSLDVSMQRQPGIPVMWGTSGSSWKSCFSSPVRMCVVLGCHPGPNVRFCGTPVTLVLLWPKYPIETTWGRNLFGFLISKGFVHWCGWGKTGHCISVHGGRDVSGQSWTSLWTERQRMTHQQGPPLVTSPCQLASPPKKFPSLWKWHQQLGSKCLKCAPAETFHIQSLTCEEWWPCSCSVGTACT